MVFGEIVIWVVMIGALSTTIAALVYLVYATLLERRLLRARPASARLQAARTLSHTGADSIRFAAVTPRAATPDRRRRHSRSTAVSQGRG